MKLILENGLSSGYKRQLRRLREYITSEQKVEEIAQKFPNYTLHDMAHFEQVAKNLGELCKSLDIDDKQRFCLLAASYCHDLGMAHGQAADRFHEMDRNDIRKWHAKVSGDFVRNELPKACLEDELLRQAVAVICEGHGRWDWDHEDFCPRGGVEVRLFAVLLSLADALDIRRERRNPKTIRSVEALMSNKFLEEPALANQENTGQPELKHLPRVHWLRHYYSTAPSIQADTEAGTVDISLVANIGVEKDEKGTPLRDSKGDLIPDKRQPVIEEIIQSDILSLVENSLFKEIVGGRLQIRMTHNSYPWRSRIHSIPVTTNLLFPSVLVKTAFAGGLIREMHVPLDSREAYYRARIEPFVAHDDFQVSRTWRPASLAPESVLSAYIELRQSAIHKVKTLAGGAWDFVFWTIKPYIRYLVDATREGRSDEVKERVDSLLLAPEMIRRGTYKRCFLVDSGAPDPITATPHIAKRAYYDSLSGELRLQGGYIYRNSEHQKSQFRILCQQAADGVGIDPEDAELEERLREMCKPSFGYERSLMTFSAVLQSLRSELAKKRIPKGIQTYLDRACAVLHATAAAKYKSESGSGALRPSWALVRPMSASDIPEVLRLDSECFDYPWKSERRIQGFIDDLRAFVLSSADAAVSGYCLFRCDKDEIILEKMAIRPKDRRRGLGSFMMEWTREFALQQAVRRILIRARASNAGAKAFYDSTGFHTLAKIDGYYQRTGKEPSEKAAYEMELPLRVGHSR